MSLSFPLACITLSIWAYLLTARGGFWQIERLREAAAPPASWPDIAVVIPARNEADMLPATLPTLLDEGYPGTLTIVLVDDRSEDGTGALAARIAAECGAMERVRVVSTRTLPSEWKGKVWAMQSGLEQAAARASRPKYMLFTDADIAYEKGAITRLVAEAETDNLALNSKMVLLRCESLAERFLVPAFVYFFRMLYPFRWANDEKRPLAAAAGGCMLVRHDALIRAGGLAPIRAALIDDCALGRLMKPQGRVRLGLTREIHSRRAYPRMQDIRHMVARSAYDQLGYSPLRLACCLAGMLLTYLAPVALAIFATGAARWLGMLSWAMMMVSFCPMLRFYRQPLPMAMALPLIAAFYMGFTFDSALQYRRGRGGMWKGQAQATPGMQGA